VRGDIVCRVDARSFIPPAYVRRCVEILTGQSEVVVVGGAQVPSADAAATAIERGIARALRNPWTTGFARYRRGASSGSSDTVYLGAFRATDLRSVGGWDPRFATNQDYELNQRMARRGTVWFEEGIDVAYLPRGTLGDLARQYRRFGRWKAAGWLEASVPMSRRQIVLVTAPVVGTFAVLVLARYRPLLTLIAVSAGIAIVDSRGGSGAVEERLVAIGAIPLVGMCWWLGIAEQALRHVAGQRMISGR
jgi:hypothetical protein